MIKFIKENIMFFLITIMLIVLAIWSGIIISERDNTEKQASSGNVEISSFYQEEVSNG